MKYLKEGMKLRRKPNAVSRSWWTRGKEYKVFETGNDLAEEFYILDDDGDDVYFDFDVEKESFLTNVEVIGSFEVVGDLPDDTLRVSMPVRDRFPHIRKDIRDLERAIQETKERIEYGGRIGHVEGHRDTSDLNWMKLSLLQQQWKSMNAILADLERIV